MIITGEVQTLNVNITRIAKTPRAASLFFAALAVFLSGRLETT